MLHILIFIGCFIFEKLFACEVAFRPIKDRAQRSGYHKSVFANMKTLGTVVFYILLTVLHQILDKAGKVPDLVLVDFCKMHEHKIAPFTEV